MRKWAYFKKPYKCNAKDTVYKIMIYETQKKVHLFFFIVQKMMYNVLLIITTMTYLMHQKIGKMKLMKMVGKKLMTHYHIVNLMLFCL